MELPNVGESKLEKSCGRCRISKVYMEFFFIEIESHVSRWIKTSADGIRVDKGQVGIIELIFHTSAETLLPDFDGT